MIIYAFGDQSKPLAYLCEDLVQLKGAQVKVYQRNE
jgi:hypothetical protein